MNPASPRPPMSKRMETVQPRVGPAAGAVDAARLGTSAGVNIARQAQGEMAAVASPPGY
jgi:hypothetical protein